MTPAERALQDLGIEVVVDDGLPADRVFIVAPPLMVPTDDPNVHRVDARRFAVIDTSPREELP